MTDRYVGPGGADGNDGLSWANRKLTLNGVEDTPIVAGDTVYVGPGVYRELLTCDVAGTSGNPITYIGDVAGENTDNVGGLIRITGSDNDQTTSRANAVNIAARNYRTFRGFLMDMTTSPTVRSTTATNCVLEDCWFQFGADSSENALVHLDGAGTDWTFRRCGFYISPLNSIPIGIRFDVTVDDTNHLIENCLFICSHNDSHAIWSAGAGNFTIKNCTFVGAGRAIRQAAAPTAGQIIDVNNCILVGCINALQGTVTGEIIEDYNSFFSNNNDRLNVDIGANSNSFPPLFNWPLLLDGFQIPSEYWTLSEFSPVARIAGTSESVEDLFGILRPTTSAKKSWGALQLQEAERETGTVQTGSAALTLADAGDHQIYVPVTATSTTFKVAARYESEYAGTLPRIIVRQPGQADSVDTMVAAADTWEDIEVTLTPAADPPYVVVILRSLNTSVTGDFDTYWDDLDVS